jgi:hypothetical protein
MLCGLFEPFGLSLCVAVDTRDEDVLGTFQLFVGDGLQQPFKLVSGGLDHILMIILHTPHSQPKQPTIGKVLINEAGLFHTGHGIKQRPKAPRIHSFARATRRKR